MSAITPFLTPVRVLLGDLNPSVQRYSDAAVLSGVQTALQMGKICGYALTPDQNNITPDVANPNTFALIVYHVCKLFVASEPDGYAYRTRAISEKFGNLRHFLQTIEIEIYKLENGTMFDCFQSYYAWLAGMAGLPLWEVMTDVQVVAPFQTAVISRGGITFGAATNAGQP